MGTTSAPIGFHLTLRLADDRPLATSRAAVRTLARVVVAQGERFGLLAFGAADNHLHVELAGARVNAGIFAQRVASSLRWRLSLPVPFETARIRPLVDQQHAYNTFFYVLRQDTRHALGSDPTREATSLPELLGLRAGPSALAARVRALLPRVRREELVALLPGAKLDPAREASLDVLGDAAAAAFALPHIGERSAYGCRARHAAIHAAGPGAPTRRLTEVLGVGPRAIQILRSVPPDLVAVRAVCLQAQLRTAVLRAEASLHAPPFAPRGVAFAPREANALGPT